MCYVLKLGQKGNTVQPALTKIAIVSADGISLWATQKSVLGCNFVACNYLLQKRNSLWLHAPKVNWTSSACHKFNFKQTWKLWFAKLVCLLMLPVVDSVSSVDKNIRKSVLTTCSWQTLHLGLRKQCSKSELMFKTKLDMGDLACLIKLEKSEKKVPKSAALMQTERQEKSSKC